MNLWHDKSYIAPSGPEWVERGYAMYDVHSVRFQFVYTEEQKEANRRAHTVSDVDQAVLMAAETRNSIMKPIMDAIAQNFVCYQYEDTEPAPFGSLSLIHISMITFVRKLAASATPKSSAFTSVCTRTACPWRNCCRRRMI